MNISSTKTVEFISKREQKRLEDGLFAWDKINSHFNSIGISAKLFGSMARKNVHDHSDLDILVLDTNGYNPSYIRNVAEDYADNISVDILFSDDLPQHKIDRMLKEAIA